MQYKHMLETQGYCILRQILPHELIDQYVSSFLHIHQSHGIEVPDDVEKMPDPDRLLMKRLRHAFNKQGSIARRTIFNAELMTFLRWYFGSEPVVRQPFAGFFSRRSYAHADYPDLRSDPLTSDVRAWCALEDVNPKAGPLFLLPRSYLLRLQAKEDILLDNPTLLMHLKDECNPTTSTKFLQTMNALEHAVMFKTNHSLETLRIDALVPRVQKGDCILFFPDTIHGSVPCHVNATRKYLISSWSSFGAQWYHARAYWSTSHDYRCSANSLQFVIDRDDFGCEIDAVSLFREYWQSFGKRIMTVARFNEAS